MDLVDGLWHVVVTARDPVVLEESQVW
jgi:hypothetical protein